MFHLGQFYEIIVRFGLILAILPITGFNSITHWKPTQIGRILATNNTPNLMCKLLLALKSSYFWKN